MVRENERKKCTGRKRLRSLTAAAALLATLLTGCGGPAAAEPAETDTPREIAYTVPPDGDPGNETCRGSYTAEAPISGTAAVIGDREISNAELGVYYGFAVSAYEAGEGQPEPDWSLPLEGQLMPEQGITWQQYFLRQALETMHTLEALELQSHEMRMRHEECFHADPEFHEKYMGHVPAISVLYSMENPFKVSKMHQQWLDGLPELVEKQAKDQGYPDGQTMLREQFGEAVTMEVFLETLERMNLAYMFYTELSYDEEPTDEEILEAMEPSGELMVDLRNLMLRPEDGKLDQDGRVTATEEQWEACRQDAEKIFRKWKTEYKTEGRFAIKAHDKSRDTASNQNGGLYAQVTEGQLVEPLNSWCFDPERKPGDTELLKSDYGWHILYFSGSRDAAYEQTRFALIRERMEALTAQAREAYPMTVSYENIRLAPLNGPVKLNFGKDLLYPDVAHERIDEVPVYIQQDYRGAAYGGHTVSSHGCGITSLAMLSTYMADTILTPGMLAARYAGYGSNQGTDAGAFYYTPPEMGYYVNSHVYEWDQVEPAMQEGRKVINLQHKGYFTRGGHYLVLSELTEDGNVVIRDSNIYNYTRLKEHSQDHFPPEKIQGASQGYWIYDFKILNTPFCSRCGDAPVPHPWDTTDAPKLIAEDYLCPKCRTAMDRRDSFLTFAGLQS